MRELKSILKPPRSSHPNPQPSSAEAERIALAHARILADQRALESRILSAITTLSTLAPSSSPPSAGDIRTFKTLILPFQPSDYDDLIEERNINALCGYALCANPRRRFSSGSRFRLLNKNRPDFAIVETRDLERWCSDACARRALYVKVQLNETAAWERVAMSGVRIDLLEEDEDDKKAGARDDGLARDIAALKIGEEERKGARDQVALSLERGEGDGRMAAAMGPRVELTIREKDVTSVASPPKQGQDDQEGDGHLLLEGHKTRSWTATEKPEDEDEKTEDEDEQSDAEV
jgi:hypothetical protein